MLLRKVINAAGVKVDGDARQSRPSAASGRADHDRAAPSWRARARSPENIPLDILYEDAEIAAINKPAGMVVHPGKGHWAGTLTAALQFHFDQLSSAGGPTRPGIVHRLDRDTSGVMVVAKTDQVHMHLADQFEHRTVEKEYFAICAGVPEPRSRLDRSAGRLASASSREDGHSPRSRDEPRGAKLL